MITLFEFIALIASFSYVTIYHYYLKYLERKRAKERAKSGGAI